MLMQHLLHEFLDYHAELNILLYLNPDLQARIQTFIDSLEESSKRIQLIPFRPRGGIRSFIWEQITLPQIIRKQKVDLLFSYGNTGPRFPGCRQILYLQQALPYSSFKPDRGRFQWQLRQWLYSKLTDLTQQGSYRVIVPTQWLVEPMRKSMLLPKPSSHYRVTLPGVPRFKNNSKQHTFAPHEIILFESLEQWRASDEKILLYPCYLASYKNIPYLLDAIRYLKQQNLPSFHLLLTFDQNSPETFLSKSAIMNSVAQDSTDIILLTGKLSRAAIDQVYRMTDILVFPSLVETLGLPLLEAMAHAIPIVSVQSERPNATEAAFAREICEDGALYADPKSPAAFAQQIATLLNDPALAFEIGIKGKQRAQTLSWRKHVEQILSQ